MTNSPGNQPAPLPDAGREEPCEHEWVWVTRYNSDETNDGYLQCRKCNKQAADNEDVYLHATRFIIADMPHELFEYPFKQPVHRSKWISTP